MEEMQKTLITEPSVLASLEPIKTLLLYVAVTTHVVSAPLVVEQEEPKHVYKVKRPVYYISRVLSDYDALYNQVQKLLYVILIMKHNLPHYFESHLIRMVTSHGLRKIIKNRLPTGRIAKWALELRLLNITYIQQTAIKSHALVDFMAEWIKTQQSPALVTQEHWSMYFDDSFTLNEARGGIVLISPKGDRLLYVIQLHFCATNNVAEYESLVKRLCITTNSRSNSFTSAVTLSLSSTRSSGS
jgi:hypothetical protein